ncbi:uncharacterized protein L199_007209 [Kwoniella botswanensis]|uniref:uncharacterized protein n=1 Tax=Kwoniella botswanensis TaxID=1268659 RepID=UPI00315D85C6
MAPPPLSHHPSTSSTSSDEPIYIPPPSSKAGPGPSTHRYIPKRSTVEPESLVILDDDEEDEDEPVFVGTKISNLVQKYKLNHDVLGDRVRSSSSSTSRSPSVGPSTVVSNGKSSKKETKVNSRSTSDTSSRKGKSKGKSKINQPITIIDDEEIERTQEQRQPSLPLLPDLALVPLPVPDWLGRTAILLPLDNCVVCKIRFKKTDSGAAKWRHISTCRPPLYRPPNPPPDLKHLINEGLLQVQSKSTEPTSLLDLHVRRSDSLEDVSSPSNKGKKKSLLGLRSFTSVKASHERLEDDWEKQVRSRLKEFIGDSSPPREPEVELGSIPKTPSPNTSPSNRKLKGTETRSDTEDEMDLYLPSTQSLGESSLAQIYAKQSPSGSPSGSPSRSPITPVDSPNRQSEDEDADFDIPLPPSSQKRQFSQREGLDFYEDGNDLSCMDENPEEKGEGEGEGRVGDRTKKPFRGWGDPRVDGDLSYDEIDNDERLFALGWGEIASTITPSPTPQRLLGPSSIYSTTPTPRASTSTMRRREQFTTPTPAQIVYTIPSSSPDIEVIHQNEDEDNWGDEAVLSWDGAGGGSSHEERDNEDDEAISVSSVAPSEAGLDEEEEDKEEWGRDAYLEWAWDEDDVNEEDEAEGLSATSDDEHTRDPDKENADENEGVGELETTAQLIQRGMPDYSTWELKKLQKLVTGYGFRTSNDHQALEKIAMECWKAINPALLHPAAHGKPKSKTSSTSRKSTEKDQTEMADRQSERERESSISSADVPLAQVKSNKGKSKRTAINVKDSQEEPLTSPTPTQRKAKAKAKAKEKEKEREEPKGKTTYEALSKMFYKLIMDDHELYLRILRYEPISFDELISKSIASGIDKERRGWKKDLKRYLDLQSISFFTEDPTGQRRRH